MQAIHFAGARMSGASLQETIAALAAAARGDGANAVRDVLATWAAREGLGATDAGAVAEALRVSRVTAWRLLDRLDAACARAGLAAGPPGARFTPETPVLSPVKEAPLGGRGASALRVLAGASHPGSTQSEGSALRARGLEGRGRAAGASLEECTQAVSAKLHGTGRLGPGQVRALLDWVACQWHKVQRCKGERRPYAVAVAMNRARELGWLPKDGRAAGRALAQAKPCARCGSLWTPIDGCGCPRAGAAPGG